MSHDNIDRKLLNLIQADFPLVHEPYAELGGRLDIDGDEVIERIARFKQTGLVRQISPVIDGRRLGYQTTLVAMRVPETSRETAEETLRQHPGISHGYERDHRLNVWFTLALPPEKDIDKELAELTAPFEAEAVFALPAIKLFKIGAYFDIGGDGAASHGVKARRHDVTLNPSGALPERIALSEDDRGILRQLQQDLPLEPTPYAAMAADLGIDEATFLAGCRQLLDRGVMRRYGASVNHRQAGFEGNGMACWTVATDAVDDAGRRLSALAEVSHCYERKTNPDWPYNLFAMMHGKTPEDCRRIAVAAAADIGLDEPQILFSTREFKKTRVRYQL